MNHWSYYQEHERDWILRQLGYEVPPRQRWQREASREYARFNRQIARAFRIPLRLLISLPSVPAKAAHKRRYQRRR